MCTKLVCLDVDGTLSRDGELVAGAGPLAAFFEYAAGARAEVLGKPSPLLFDDLATAAGVRRDELLMVGDDAEFDVSAPAALGVRAVLVRTGKYSPGDEARHAPRPAALLDKRRRPRRLARRALRRRRPGSRDARTCPPRAQAAVAFPDAV